MIKKTIILTLVFAHLALILLVSGIVFLEEVYPFHPGELLYSLQNIGEQARLSMTSGRASRAEYAMTLSERRLADLARAATPERISAAVQAFEKSLQQAAVTLDEAPQGAQEVLYQKLDAVLVRSDVVARTLSSQANLPTLQELHMRLAAYQQAADRPAQKAALLGEISGAPVPFMNNTAVDHGSFDMFGGHYGVACQSCHKDGEYKGTADDCNSCHQPAAYQVYLSGIVGYDMTDYITAEKTNKPAVMYPNHYPGQCSDCHTVDDWTPKTFNHKGVFECLSCHEDDIPRFNKNLIVNQTHYPGDCKLCHSSFDSWQVTEFGHEGVEACESCHNQDTPAFHYEGACTNCHLDIQDWNTVVFDHSSRTDCQTCHTGDAPANHFDGQCSNCHDTGNWLDGEFEHPSGENCGHCHDAPADHNNYNVPCTSCHNAKKSDWGLVSHSKDQNCTDCHSTPAYHYNGVACSTCHKYTAWSLATIDHNNFDGTCLSCHEASVSSSHYTGECDDCHTTSTWSDYDFNHTYYQDCVSCHVTEADHYTGQCSDCHSTDDWVVTEVDHGDLYDCLSCHATPQDHWPGQCSACHVTNDWSEIYFDHTTYTNCKSCHSRPTGHPRGQCSECHTTTTWLIEPPTATPTLMTGTGTPLPTATSTPANTPQGTPKVTATLEVASTVEYSEQVITKPTQEPPVSPVGTAAVEVEVAPVPLPVPLVPKPPVAPAPIPLPPVEDEYEISPILQVNEMDPLIDEFDEPVGTPEPGAEYEIR